ncbi:hypothetical protein VP01_1601g5 [Puccinia sorghi]|uniref:Uncharacterized protein n=1 Tax=Puccinia sorghi TaxID=27349 RepID=A0A0L6VJ57_9BASI|nr:hypothetical protein VP01_1601g5 [Puccinia sorghi]
MHQKTSQHKQLLQAASTTAFLVINDTFQPGAPPLNFNQDMISGHVLNLLNLIKPYPIFYNQSQNPQQDFSIQLAISTCHLGSNGNGAAFLILKNLFQFGYGTINLYTTRVIKVIYNMQSQSCKNRVFLPVLVVWMPVIQDHAMKTMYSQTCRFLSSL